jgi:hypothetical protein
MENKFDQFKNTMWCAPKHYEAVLKHKKVFEVYLKDKVKELTVKDDSYMPEKLVLIVTDNLELITIPIK